MKHTLLLTALALLFVIPCAAQGNSKKLASAQKAEMFSAIEYYCGTEISMHIERFSKVLRKKPTSKAYVIFYAPNNEYPAEYADAILNLVKEQLEENRIAPDRIVLLVGGVREHRGTELFIVPKGADQPIPSPTTVVKNHTLKP